jgi:hypothetical protein
MLAVEYMPAALGLGSDVVYQNYHVMMGLLESLHSI